MNSTQSPRPPNVLRHLPLALILGAAVIGAIAFRDVLTFDALARHREALLAFRDAHYLWASLGFVAAYAVIVALSVPGATIATLAGGFLFGLFPGALYNVLAASLGAAAVFVAARAGLGADVAEKLAARGGAVARLQEGLRANQWSVLLMMRLVPVVPFFLANLIPAFAGIRFVPFVVTTAVGIVPGALVFTSVGAGLGEVFARGEAPDLSIIFTAPVLLPLLGLAALSALPMLIKALRRKEV
ncbi:MAG: TVP38/TMEM64 family protein [Paracoccaceae bacterium]